jgi:hypothetical protein
MHETEDPVHVPLLSSVDDADDGRSADRTELNNTGARGEGYVRET